MRVLDNIYRGNDCSLSKCILTIKEIIRTDEALIAFSKVNCTTYRNLLLSSIRISLYLTLMRMIVERFHVHVYGLFTVRFKYTHDKVAHEYKNILFYLSLLFQAFV